MYRSIYPYNNKDSGFLQFDIGHVFNLIEQIDGFWWSVLDEKGKHGLVPATYLEVNKVTEEDVLRSLDRSIESISKSQGNGKGALNEEQRRILQKLISHRQMVSAGNSLWNKGSSPTPSSNGIPQQPKRQAPKAPSGNSINKGKSLKRNSAPAPPVGSGTPRSKSVGSRVSQSSFDEGASSKIYNIVVNNGNTQLPVNCTSPTSTLTQKDSFRRSNIKKTPSAENFRVFVERTNSTCSSGKDSPDSSLKTSQEENNTANSNGITELRGKNLTISKSNGTNTIVGGLTATNFKVSKNNCEGEKGKSKIVSPKSEKASIPVQKTISSKTTKAPAAPVQRSATEPIQNDSVVKTVNSIDHYGSVSSLCSTSLNSFNTSSTPNLSMTVDSCQTDSVFLGEIEISDEIGKDLIDTVRSRCKLSFNKSLAAVRTVLQTLGEEVPDIKGVTNKIRSQIVDDKLSVHRGALAHEDATRLQDILDKLTEHKEDSQQRNWAVHEDFEIIKDLLDGLIQTMGEIDPSVSRNVLREDEYRYINDLTVYYQMEHRSKLRIMLLQVFGCFCELGAEYVTTLLCSVLPTELALDIMQDQKDILKFLTSCLVLTMVFSTGESIPYNHYVQFNEAFFNFVLDTIEDPPEADAEDQVSDALVGVLLAFNQHFRSPKNNIVLQCIAQRTMFRTLSEKILLLVNREKDPVAMFDFVHSVPDSVMKFLIDLFASSKTAGIFFTNDLMVLIDIILRQIMDRPVKDKARTEYLSLFHSLLNTTNYSEHRHRAADFKRCFDDIMLNREQESDVDLYIVTEITKRFSDLF